MKLRLIATAILAFLVAVPVIATSDRFTDVPQDHEHRTAIDWAYGRGLFKGYPDRSFKPDRALSENELQIVVKRLFDSYDEITRSQTASILYYGITGLEGGPSTTTTTTLPITTATTTITTTTTTVPSTIAAPFSCPFPLGEVDWLSENTFRFPIDNGQCNVRFFADLDPSYHWGTGWIIKPNETGYSSTFTWPIIQGSERERIEVRVTDLRAGTFYSTYYHLNRDGSRTTITTEVEGFQAQ